ncbi:MAG: hypothetical protein ACYCPT_12705 [Acidimicrobiales bacterium]
MQTYYVTPAGFTLAEVPSSVVSRAQALTASLIVGDPSGLVTAYPSVVVMSPALATVVIPDDTGQATLAEVQTAQTNATDAENTKATNIANAKTAIINAVGTLPNIQSRAQTDLNTLSTSTSATAPILTRIITDSLTMAETIVNLLTALEIIE